MKVGITGASGFIGKHVIRRLRVRGHKAMVFTREGGGRMPASVSTRPLPKAGPAGFARAGRGGEPRGREHSRMVDESQKNGA